MTFLIIALVIVLGAAAHDTARADEALRRTAAGLFGQIKPSTDATSSEAELGRGCARRHDVACVVTKDYWLEKEEDRYVFRVPMLRNVAKTAPYFHDGSVERVVER